ncbi:MAG: peroxide stress protein YaaA [Patescibacteria group bacterium]|nr:peroxide stress protein YaaA [Patescibacteria group bacterium]
MLIVTSPAKTLDFSSDWRAAVNIPVTEPAFIRKACEIAAILRSYSPEKLGALMHLSDKLAAVNAAQYATFIPRHTPANSRPAILAYSGDIYRQLRAHHYTEPQQKYLQNSLRILSGLYGLLRPYDLIQPYRLEMKTPLTIGTAANLYAFWRHDITKALNETAKQNGHTILLNLASDECANAIDRKLLTIPVTEVVFTQEKEGKIFNYGLFAKRGRGSMIQYLAETQGMDLAVVRAYDRDGYRLVEETEGRLVFRKSLVQYGYSE